MDCGRAETEVTGTLRQYGEIGDILPRYLPAIRPRGAER